MGQKCSKLLWLCVENQNMSDTIDIEYNLDEIREISDFSEDYYTRPRSLTFPMSSNITQITKKLLSDGYSNQKSASLQQF